MWTGSFASSATRIAKSSSLVTTRRTCSDASSRPVHRDALLSRGTAEVARKRSVQINDVTTKIAGRRRGGVQAVPGRRGFDVHHGHRGAAALAHFALRRAAGSEQKSRSRRRQARRRRAPRVDCAARRARAKLADGDDAIAANADVGIDGRGPGAVEHLAVADQDIEADVCPERVTTETAAADRFQKAWKTEAARMRPLQRLVRRKRSETYQFDCRAGDSVQQLCGVAERCAAFSASVVRAGRSAAQRDSAARQ